MLLIYITVHTILAFRMFTVHKNERKHRIKIAGEKKCKIVFCIDGTINCENVAAD
jgi:hypothetical protein